MCEIFSRKFVLYNIKSLYLHRVFHGIRFKVNNEDWLSVKMAFFFLWRLLLMNLPCRMRKVEKRMAFSA